ncbi:hypothetical protein ABBQ32_007136 [Trebouxia sp. C0010 RCD-2024]
MLASVAFCSAQRRPLVEGSGAGAWIPLCAHVGEGQQGSSAAAVPGCWMSSHSLPG